MQTTSAKLALAIGGALLLAGCSSSSGLFGNALTTQSISTSPNGTAVAAGKVDPTCTALAQRIETLRSDGLTERLEKAGTGKSSTVSVKRDSLAKAAELDKANAEFQAKCSTVPRPVQQAAASTAPAGASAGSAPATAAPPIVVQQR
ncbi:hypothetical protein [Hyphomicrobium sp. CS1GBMeth3]|uniref:hypothetical protein n=1 Tax=Hyphomicrobium sp. CS1GBMeth3 TaxID=1892845 RepID=UPI000930B056|nr:hypothetical protein [Hyphomicrobium sp. CS1GBMeth3]